MGADAPVSCMMGRTISAPSLWPGCADSCDISVA